MAENALIKYFDNFRGVDLRVSDLKREQGASTEEKNVTRRRTGALSKRKGYQIAARTAGGNGLFNYLNRETGASSTTTVEELLSVDDELNRLVTGEAFNITYSGSDTAYFDFSLNPADSNFYFELYDNNVLVLSTNVGTGRETSFVTITTLVAAIHAVTNFSCTTSSTYATEPAAFLPISLNTTIPTTPGVDVEFSAWEQVADPSGVSTVLSGHNDLRDTTGFRNMAGVSLDEVLYLNGDGIALSKYDGNRVYSAGMVAPVIPVDAGSAAGALTGIFKYKTTYEHYDAKGNIIESDASPELTVNIAAKDQDLTLAYLQNTTGYNTDQGTVSSGTTSATLTLTAPHTLQPLDNVAVYNNGIVERRKVLSITSTTAVLDASVVSTTNDIVASAVSVKLWRTKAGGTLFYLHSEYTNDGGTATFAVTDSTLDAALGAEYIDPVKPHTVAVENCKYSTVWRGQLITAGNSEKPLTVYYSDIDSGEYFPTDNSFDIETRTGKEITGLKALDNLLYVFTEDAIIAVSGDLASDSFVVDVYSDEGIGCMSHSTIQEIDSSIWFLSKSSIYSISQKGLKEESSQISPKFKTGNLYDYNRATAYHWVDQRQYLLQMPVTTDNGSGANYTAPGTSDVFVYDRFFQGWTLWENYDFTGGMATLNNDLYMMDRSLDLSTSGVRYYLKRVHNTGLTYDYADHESPIEFYFKSHWETLGEPSMFKKYRRIKVFSLDASLNDFESQSFSLTTTVESDYVPFAASDITFDFGGGALGWGTSPWSNFAWGEVRLYTLKHKLNQRRSKAARVVLANSTANENVLISGYELDIAMPYRKEIKE